MDRPGFGPTALHRRGPLAEGAGQVAQVPPAELDRLLVGGGEHVAASRHRAVHPGPAQLLERRLLADGHLDHSGRPDVEARLAVHHDHAVGERGQVGGAGRRRAEEHAHLRHHPGELDLVVEDAAGVEATREDLDLLRDAPARRVHEVDHRHLQPLGALLDAHDLLDGLLAPRARLHGVVVGHHAHRAAADRAHPGDHAVGGGVRLLVAREEEILLELGAGIQEQLQAVADEELAFVLELLAVLDVALLDAGPFLPVALLAHAGLRGRGWDWPRG